ncbi:tetratricopeptide repeat protein [Polaromonas glacialis]|uniref:tetratricopeptide repeat protein n=1 Tax=Polaromonas glacialis TaxID=866564 RepID=UPI00068E0B66|nr:tetratricopeptide repeat protein [Polaromonas glacialis]
MRVFNQHLVCLLLKAQALALLACGKHAKALPRFDRMLVLVPADRYALSSRAHVLVQLNRLDESIVNLQQLTRIAGSKEQLGAAWFNLGYVLKQKGRHGDAVCAFKHAVGYCPGMDQAWYGLALALIEQGRLHEARNMLIKTTTLQPMAPHGWYRLGQVELALGAPEKALQVVDRLRQFEPRVAAQLKRDIGVDVPFLNRQRDGAAYDDAR